MEKVLEVYEQPYVPSIPVVCMDEQPVQLTKEVRAPIKATRNHPKRIDYKYERAGTASIFLFAEPLAGWRSVEARERKTKSDWAMEVAELLDGRYAECEKVILVCDNLNTHTKGAFYEAFEPPKARAYVKRIQFCYPKHDSWLNITESELSALARQCLRDRRMSDVNTLNDEVKAWSEDINTAQRGVDWQMRIDPRTYRPQPRENIHPTRSGILTDMDGAATFLQTKGESDTSRTSSAYHRVARFYPSRSRIEPRESPPTPSLSISDQILDNKVPC